VPREILFDNAKCIMIERDAFGEGKHRWNASLLGLSRDYGCQSPSKSFHLSTSNFFQFGGPNQGF